jgi:hypothetical protein
VRSWRAGTLRGLPAFLAITSTERSDVVWLDDLPKEPGSSYLLDRGYIDFRRPRRISKAGAFSLCGWN